MIDSVFVQQITQNKIIAAFSGIACDNMLFVGNSDGQNPHPQSEITATPLYQLSNRSRIEHAEHVHSQLIARKLRNMFMLTLAKVARFFVCVCVKRQMGTQLAHSAMRPRIKWARPRDVRKVALIWELGGVWNVELSSDWSQTNRARSNGSAYGQNMIDALCVGTQLGWTQKKLIGISICGSATWPPRCIPVRAGANRVTILARSLCANYSTNWGALKRGNLQTIVRAKVEQDGNCDCTYSHLNNVLEYWY